MCRQSGKERNFPVPNQDPVKGSTSRKYPELNKVKDLSLSTHDVDGAQPKAPWAVASQSRGTVRGF